MARATFNGARTVAVPNRVFAEEQRSSQRWLQTIQSYISDGSAGREGAGLLHFHDLLQIMSPSA